MNFLKIKVKINRHQIYLFQFSSSHVTSCSTCDLRQTQGQGQVIKRFRIFGQVINRVGNIPDFGHKKGKGFGKRAAHPHPIFLGVPPTGV